MPIKLPPLFPVVMSDDDDSHTATSVATPDIDSNRCDVEKDGSEKPTTLTPPPDGGREAWLTIAGAFLVQFCTFGYINAFGVYQDYYTREFLNNRTASEISWIGSFQLFMQYAPGVVVGRAFDAGYFHYVMIVGSVLYVFSMFMVSLAQPFHYYQVFLSQAVGMGIGQGMLFLPSLTIVGHHFKRRRALAIGIVVSGASCGGIVFPIMLNKLGQRTTFANGIRASASLVAVLLLIANFLMKTRLAPKQQRPAMPPPDLKAILTDRAYIVSMAAAFCINLGLFFPFFYLQLYAVEKGVTPEVAFYALTILNAGSVIGRLLPNFLADRVGVYNMLIPCLLMSAILSFGFLGVKSFASIVIFGVLYGFSSGAYVSLIPSLLGQLSTHIGELGTRMGIAFSVVGVAMLIGTPIEGALLAHKGPTYIWWRSIVFCGILVTTGSALMTLSRFLFIKRKGGGQFV